MTELSNAEIRRTLSEYNCVSSNEMSNSIRRYISLLLLWNRRISLTTVTAPTEIVRFHFGESVFAASVVPISCGRLVDVGSGAGFPGLPLRLASAEIRVVLIESNSKKAAFLSEVARELALSGVEVFRGRMSELSNPTDKFDFVTARAVGKHYELLTWAHGRLRESGKVVLWLGQEGVEAVSGVGGWKWQTPVEIPGSRKRFILAGSPI